jgi:hypothetical protein
MFRWLIRIVAVASITVSIALVVPQIVFRWPEGPYTVFAVSLNASIAVAYVAVGWLIVERRPGNPIGPILLAIGAMYAWAGPADQYLSLPEVVRYDRLLARMQDPDGYAATHTVATVAALFLATLQYPITILGPLALILFPDGRLPSPRWRWAIPAALLVLVIGTVGVVFSDRPLLLAWPTYRSPFGMPGFPSQTIVLIADRLALAFASVAAIALFLRWRRDDPVERAQIKWVVAGVLVLVATTMVDVFYESGRYDWETAIVGLGPNIALILVVIAIGVAILRYRLYEIDRIVSRTIGWALVTGVLAVVFTGVVLMLQAGLSTVTRSGGTVAVAASTLAVFALFQPVRRRIQRTVDRRFDRARYDADRTASAFSERLRVEVDLASVTADLQVTTQAALSPTSLGIWLRRGART